jgi:hypothetical protein
LDVGLPAHEDDIRQAEDTGSGEQTLTVLRRRS